MEKKKRLKIIVLVGISLLLVGTLIFFKMRYGNSSSSSDSAPIASYLPIWIAIFPAMLANSGEKKELNDNEKKLALFFGIVTALMVVVTIVYLIFG